MLGQASHELKRAAKKAARLAKKRHLAPACVAALKQNLLQASSLIKQLEKTR